LHAVFPLEPAATGQVTAMLLAEQETRELQRILNDPAALREKVGRK
jgi:hypothetical protein